MDWAANERLRSIMVEQRNHDRCTSSHRPAGPTGVLLTWHTFCQQISKKVSLDLPTSNDLPVFLNATTADD